MTHDATGRWYCQFVDQEQSDSEADEFGEYEDFGREPQKAAKTEFAGATLELFDDGRYILAAQDYNSSHGTWTAEGRRLSLTEAEDCTNGYEGLEYADGDADRFVLSFKLNADSHDGLDILVLTFGRDAPKQAGPLPADLVERLLAAEDEDEVYDALDAAFDGESDGDDGDDDDDGNDGDDDGGDDDGERGSQREAADIARELWDAWLEGRFASDPESDNHWLQVSALADERVTEAGAFTHAHARHGLETLNYDDDRELFDIVEEQLGRLPEDDAADAELAPLIASRHGGKWIERVVDSRFVGGGQPEALFHRPLMPQPATDEASRAYLLRHGYFTRFEAIEGLFPPGHPDLAKIVIRYRGRGLLDLPLGLIDARGIAAEALAAAVDWLANPNTAKASSTGLSAMLFAVVLSVRAGEAVPEVALEALAADPGRGMIMGGLSDAEKATLRELVAELPEDQRALIHARFYLDPKPA